MKFISLFSGIGGFDLGFERAGLGLCANTAKFFGRQFSLVRKAVAVWAQNNAVIQGMPASVSARIDVMRITRSFIPAAAHTGVGEQAAHCLVPASLVRVNSLRLVNVRLSLVPDFQRAVGHIFTPRCSLGFGLLAVLVSPYIESFAPLLIKSRAGHSTATRAFDDFHSNAPLIRRYVYYSIYPPMTETK